MRYLPKTLVLAGVFGDPGRSLLASHRAPFGAQPVLFHLAQLFAAALKPDHWPGDIDDRFPPALRALTRLA
jgi:hypothetical protein